ncbi:MULTISPECIES: substrate-binding domain-containing protein [Roseateles]|uniref:Molybdate transport system substrate-binding protein n=1 Tax=Pelomonas aquatica TaxID=431058 RepID=A0ABU1Z4L6_9BURK|nr:MULTISPECIES: substrate-binding domain-containing protein [Roseateles]MDR7295544.1 molybdate transport system substrate-binding protein [Pelomonas aquatica]
MPRAEITLLSSMATQPLLAALARAHEQAGGAAVRLESVGGVDAAKRVQAGEAFDVVVLADDALAALAAQGLVHAPRPVADSRVAIAVRDGTPPPDVSSEAALRRCLLAARSIGYSTGPSGRALLQVFERWGLADTLKGRLVQARPGVPVGQLVAAGEAEIGFQQFSELQGLPGLTLLGGMPPGLEIVTTFAGAVGTRSAQPDEAQALLDFLTQAGTAALKRAHDMDAPAAQFIRKTKP